MSFLALIIISGCNIQPRIRKYKGEKISTATSGVKVQSEDSIEAS